MAYRSIWLLAGLVWAATPVAAQTNIADAFARMNGQQITGATIITHGFTSSNNGGGYLLPLAQAIRNQIAAQTGEPVWLLDYDLTNDGVTGVFGAGSNFPAMGPPQSGHVVLLFDWGAESNETSNWWAETAGDALFALGTGLGIYSPRNQSTAPTQFIAHSFGTVATTEAVERLAAYTVPVAQVTLIDPHDFDQSDVPTFDEAQRMSDLGAPAGYGATIWNNVAEADVYYQTRGNQDPLVSIVTADPEGRPIPGATNRLLDGSDELPAGNPYSFGSLNSDHSYAWNAFYLSTVSGSRVPGTAAPATADFDYTQTGWGHSIHNANRVPIAAPNFYEPGQSHEHSVSQVVTPAGNPNTTGLAQLGLTSQQVIDGRFAPEFAAGDIANGNFSSGFRENASVDLIAGWSHHGGGGDSVIVAPQPNPDPATYLTLDAFNGDRTHNYNYIPINAYELVYDFRVANSSVDETLQIRVGNQVIASQSVTNSTTWQTQRIAIPANLRDSVSTFGVSLVYGSNSFDTTEVNFDNFRYEIATPVADTNIAIGGTIDLGSLWLGESKTLEHALTIGNSGHIESILDLLRPTSSDPLFSLLGLDSRVSLGAASLAAAFDLAFAGSTIAGEFLTTLQIITNIGTLEWIVSANVENRYAGDFNGDGLVDAADYTVWRDSLGTTNILVDADRSGLVDAGDYAIWRSQFGWTSPPPKTLTNSVPEPTTICLVASIFVGVILSCRFPQQTAG